MNGMNNVISGADKIHYQGQVPNLNFVSGRSKLPITKETKFVRGSEVRLTRYIPGNGE